MSLFADLIDVTVSTISVTNGIILRVCPGFCGSGNVTGLYFISLYSASTSFIIEAKSSGLVVDITVNLSDIVS